jgi:hypothetical protein
MTNLETILKEFDNLTVKYWSEDAGTTFTEPLSLGEEDEKVVKDFITTVYSTAKAEGREESRSIRAKEIIETCGLVKQLERQRILESPVMKMEELYKCEENLDIAEARNQLREEIIKSLDNHAK